MRHPFDGINVPEEQPAAATPPTRRGFLGLAAAVAGLLGLSATARAQVIDPGQTPRPRPTTKALGEEGGPPPTTRSRGEEGGTPTTRTRDEEGGRSTTAALAEEGGRTRAPR